jgi:hypothetical protein
MKFVLNDGGRKKAGFKSDKARDCVCRAISIATEQDYKEVYNALNQLAEQERPRSGTSRSNANRGVQKPLIRRFMAELGWKWVPTMGVGTGCKVHLKREELPSGRLVVSVSKHLVAVIDGVIHDNHDSSRNGTRCVYGYWVKK